MLPIMSVSSRKSQEDEMSNFGQKQPDPAPGEPGSPDSPKPHGDKLAGVARGADKRPSQEGGASNSAPGTPDSPKPHGDKLANAVRAAAKGSQPDR
jgi:hypothetical protein